MLTRVPTLWLCEQGISAIFTSSRYGHTAGIQALLASNSRAVEQSKVIARIPLFQGTRSQLVACHTRRSHCQSELTSTSRCPGLA
eukprot:2329923-Rhodomonas_salina.1